MQSDKPPPFEQPSLPSPVAELQPEVATPEAAAMDLKQSVSSIFEGHLHPLTIVFGLAKGARALIPLIPVVVFGGRGYGVGAMVVASIATVASAFVRYFSFGFRIERGELVIEQGIIERRHRSIPLDRVQEIRVEQGVLHRIFDVVDATIETGAGGGVEAKLSVLSRTESDRLRQAVFEHRSAVKFAATEAGPAQAPLPPEETIIRKIGLKELIVAGLTSNHLLSALALAGAIWNFADDIIPDNAYRRLADYVYRHAEFFAVRNTRATLMLAFVGLIAVFAIGAIFSIIGTIVLFYDFTFSRRGDDLRRHYGLLTRRASSLPRRRIQILEIEEKLMRRLFGLATLRADTSGDKREGKDDNEGRDVLLPIVRRKDVDGLLPEFFPDLVDDRAEWRQVSRLAIWRGMIEGAAVCLLAALAFFVFQRDVIALWPIAFLPIAWWMNLKSYRHLGYAFGERYFQTRRGWLGRSTHIVPINKIQAIELRRTPFDRRLGLASLSIDTAGQAYTEGGPRIENLPLDEALAIARALARKASITKYRS